MSLNLKELVKPSRALAQNPILQNPLWISVIITGIILIIIWFVMHNEIEMVYEDTSFLMLLFKAGIWSFVASLFVVFLHNKAIESNIANKYKDTDKERLMSTIVDGTKNKEGSGAALKPNI